jgi:hypothetical protein
MPKSSHVDVIAYPVKEPRHESPFWSALPHLAASGPLDLVRPYLSAPVLVCLHFLEELARC